mgnify:CR=1 FL=1
MLDKSDLDYFNYSRSENVKFWRRLEDKPNFKNKTVLDFGCGHGALSIDIGNLGAKSILGIDLEERPIEFAKENLIKNFETLKDKINFEKVDILKSNQEHKYDIIVSKDTFEHTVNLPEVLKKMYNLLNEGGKAYFGFGPLYNFYNGDHGRLNVYLPWFHLIFNEKFLIKRINKKKNLDIKKVQDLGLSRYSFADYKKIFNDSNFKIKFFKTNLSDHPASIIFNFLSKFELLKEYCTYNIYCILEK